MTVKGKMNKTEKYCIEKMVAEGTEISEIAEFLGRTEKTVEKFASTLSVAQTDERPKKNKNEALFVRNTVSKGNKGVSVMTESESTRGEKKKKRDPKAIIPSLRDKIHKIHEDE